MCTSNFFPLCFAYFGKNALLCIFMEGGVQIPQRLIFCSLEKCSQSITLRFFCFNVNSFSDIYFTIMTTSDKNQFISLICFIVSFFFCAAYKNHNKWLRLQRPNSCPTMEAESDTDFCPHTVMNTATTTFYCAARNHIFHTDYSVVFLLSQLIFAFCFIES